MKKARKNQEIPDLRYDYTDMARVNGGVIYRKNTVVQVVWENGVPETWWLESSPENLQIAKEFFTDKKNELTY